MRNPIIDEDGSEYWYLKGKRHREDGPAIEYANGSKYWYLNGKLHREDGPAAESATGTKCWFLNGDKLTIVEFMQQVTRTSEEKTMMCLTYA